jgi:hypothetical protein
MLEHELILQSWLQKRKWEVLQHPPLSPHLVPLHFYLFGPFMDFLSGKRFEGQNTIQKTVVQYFKSLGKEHYCEGVFKLVKRLDQYLNTNDDYVEK